MGKTIFFILLICLTFVAAVILQSTAVLLVFFLEVALVLSCILFCLYMRARLQLSLEVPAEFAGKQTPFTVYLAAKNPSILPLAQLQGTIFYSHDRLFDDHQEIMQGGVAGKHTSRLRLQLTADYCGVLALSVPSVRIYDWLGIFYINKRIDLHTEALVLPRGNAMRISLHSTQRKLQMEAWNLPANSHLGNSISDYQIREYQSGDRLKNIHWKLQAKTDQLWTKQFLDETELCPSVFLDMHTLPALSPEHVDALFELAAAISLGLQDAGIPHVVFWQSSADARLERFAIQTLADYQAMFRILLRSKALFQREAMSASARLALFQAMPQPVICLDMALQVSHAQQLKYQFTQNNYHNELKEAWVHI